MLFRRNFLDFNLLLFVSIILAGSVFVDLMAENPISELPSDKNQSAMGTKYSNSLVPAAIVVFPVSGKVLMWAADLPGGFGNDTSNSGRTVTSVFDPDSCTITELEVASTNHNMFCHGLSLDLMVVQLSLV